MTFMVSLLREPSISSIPFANKRGEQEVNLLTQKFPVINLLYRISSAKVPEPTLYKCGILSQKMNEGFISLLTKSTDSIPIYYIPGFLRLDCLACCDQ